MIIAKRKRAEEPSGGTIRFLGYVLIIVGIPLTLASWSNGLFWMGVGAVLLIASRAAVTGAPSRRGEPWSWGLIIFAFFCLLMVALAAGGVIAVKSNVFEAVGRVLRDAM